MAVIMLPLPMVWSSLETYIRLIYSADCYFTQPV